MEKRFEFYEEEFEYWIHDNVTKKNYTMYDLCYLEDLLNEQNEKIKTLETCLKSKCKSLSELQNLIQENQRLKNIQRSSKMLCRAINLVIDVYLKASEQKFPNLTKEQLMDLCLNFIKDEIDWFLEVTKKKK